MDPGMVDPRLIPGGFVDSTPIGMNAFDRNDLPSGGESIPAVDPSDDPTISPEQASRAPYAPERGPASPESTSTGAIQPSRGSSSSK